MNNQKKVKMLIALAMLIVVVLFVTVILQLVNISKTKKQIPFCIISVVHWLQTPKEWEEMEKEDDEM